MSCKTSDLRPQTSRRTSTAFSISVHFSLGLSPFVSISMHFSTTQSIFHCSNPRFNTSIHLSSTRSIFQNLSPFVIASFFVNRLNPFLSTPIHFAKRLDQEVQPKSCGFHLKMHGVSLIVVVVAHAQKAQTARRRHSV